MTRSTARLLRISSVLSLAGLVPSASWGLTFTKIVDTNTAIPGGSQTFLGFSAPSVNNGNVAFLDTAGGGLATPRGVYKYVDGAVSTVADEQTAIPSNTPIADFNWFGEPSIDEDGNVAFWGRNNGVNNAGVYSEVDGVLSSVADAQTSIPSGTGTFYVNGFSDFNSSISGGHVAFRGSNSIFATPFQEGVYTNLGGTLHAVANRTTAAPGGTGTFDDFGAFEGATDPLLIDGQIAFTATDSAGDRGIYLSSSGSLSVLANYDSFVPDEGANLQSMSHFSFDGTSVVFVGASAQVNSSYRGAVYVASGGDVSIVVDSFDPIPGKPFNFYNWGTPAIDDGNVAFQASGCPLCGYSGIFTNIGGTVIEVIGIGGTLDGKSVSSLAFGRQGISDTDIAFAVGFSDGSSAVYLAQVPEPSTSVLVGTSLMLFGERFRRRRSPRR